MEGRFQKQARDRRPQIPISISPSLAGPLLLLCLIPWESVFLGCLHRRPLFLKQLPAGGLTPNPGLTGGV